MRNLELFRHILDLACILETPNIRIFSFYLPKDRPRAEFRDEVIDRLGVMLELARERGLVLLHENESDIYGEQPRECLELMKALYCDSFKAVFDAANFIVCGAEAYPSAFDALLPYSAYFHVKDATNKDGKVSICPAGMGDARYRELLTRLWDSGYEGYLSLEPHLGNFAGLSEHTLSGFLSDLPEGGPRTFGLAARSLMAIVDEVTGDRH